MLELFIDIFKLKMLLKHFFKHFLKIFWPNNISFMLSSQIQMPSCDDASAESSHFMPPPDCFENLWHDHECRGWLSGVQNYRFLYNCWLLGGTWYGRAPSGDIYTSSSQSCRRSALWLPSCHLISQWCHTCLSLVCLWATSKCAQADTD